MAIDVVRLLILASQRAARSSRVTLTVAEDVADYLNNRKRHELARLEQEGKMIGANHRRRRRRAGTPGRRVPRRRRPGSEVPLGRRGQEKSRALTVKKPMPK